MIAAFLQQHLDYIFCFYGLAFVLLAAICATLQRESTGRLPWSWLGLFGLAHGLNEWLDLLDLSYGSGFLFSILRLGLLIVSFVFLIEFGRSGWSALTREGPGRWIYLPLLAWVGFGSLAGVPGLNAFARYTLGLLGGLWSAAVFYRAAQSDHTGRRLLISAGLSMACYAFAVGAIVAPAAFFPASVLNQTVVLEFTGLPIQLIRGLLAFLLTVTMWEYYQRWLARKLTEQERTVQRRYGRYLVLSLQLVLIGGLIFTELQGQHADRDARQAIESQVTLAAAGVNPDRIRSLAGTTADLTSQDQSRLQDQMRRFDNAHSMVRRVALLIQKEGTIRFAVPPQPAAEWGRQARGGLVDHPAAALQRVFATGQAITMGPYPDNHSLFITGYAAVRDTAADPITAVLQLEFEVPGWPAMLARHRLVAISTTLLLALSLIAFFVARQRLWISGRQIAASENRLREAQRVAQMGSWTYDVATQQVAWSEELARLFGYESPTEILFGPEQTPKILPEIWRKITAANQSALREGHGYQLETNAAGPDGTLRYFVAKAEILRGRTGDSLQVLGTIQDITERKRLEHQLLQAQKMEAIGQLAGGVAHDFNNVLAAMLLHLGLMQNDKNLTPDLQMSLQELEKGAQRAAKLTRQLLIYSHRQVPQVKPLDLNQVLADLLKMLQRILGEHIELLFPNPGTPLWIEADSGMMEQVVMNLAVNARDAMPQGGRLTINAQRIEIDPETAHAQAEARPGSFVCLEVADTGCGMTEATLQHLFEPFFTTKDIGSGTGLGLATVHGIVKQHQGWISVQSKLDQGSTFRVYLPALAQGIPAETKPKDEMVRGGPETILLVEDEPVVRMMVALSLRRYGYRILEAGNGREAIQQWEQQARQIDLLLTDMVMPEGLTGLELIERCRASKPDLKVIISSGYSLELVKVDEHIKRGIIFLPKPYESETLAATVRQCLDQM